MIWHQPSVTLRKLEWWMNMTIQLDQQDAWAMVTSSMTGIVTTLRRDGYPVTLPVWFIVQESSVYFRTPARSKKIVRILNDSRASFLVECGDQWSRLKAVSFTATATIVRDEPLTGRVSDLLAEKYQGKRSNHRLLPSATVRHYEAATEIVNLHPAGRIISWDNSRIRQCPHGEDRDITGVSKTDAVLDEPP